jgi:hypothetical protein
MRLTIRRDGKRLNLVDEVGRLQKENQRLLNRALTAEAEASLARSSSNEWRDRYHRLKQGGRREGWMSSVS